MKRVARVGNRLLASGEAGNDGNVANSSVIVHWSIIQELKGLKLERLSVFNFVAEC